MRRMLEKLNELEQVLRPLFRMIAIALLVAIWLEARDVADQADDARRSAAEAADLAAAGGSVADADAPELGGGVAADQALGVREAGRRGGE